MLPNDFPPHATVQRYFYDWRKGGVLSNINFALVQMGRVLEHKEPCPSAGVIDSQSVKTTESGGPRGYDAGKKIKGHWAIQIVKRSDKAKGFEIIPRRLRGRAHLRMVGPVPQTGKKL